MSQYKYTQDALLTHKGIYPYKWFTVKSPESYLARNYVARNQSHVARTS